MVAIIDDLESRQWIKRKPEPADRRAVVLFATSAGKEHLQEGRAAYL